MIRFKVVPDGAEPYEVTATTRDIAKWEKTSKGASFASLEADQKITDLYKIAYWASLRQGFWHGTLTEFETDTDLDLLSDDDEDGEPDPTQSAA